MNGVNTLSVYGYDSPLNRVDGSGTPFPTDDIFLLRRETSIPTERPNRPALYQDSPAFVALLHGALGQAIQKFHGDLTLSTQTLTRTGGSSITDGFFAGQRIRLVPHCLGMVLRRHYLHVR
jgi:hypothetical protein